uniref:Fucolectin tachylectin-4 pentraxin-1 domain-containing protein n=1 Tax=Aureoumbra lagunensis TaxID=44058 RepID=A0A7S3NGW4_9STRA
MDALSRRFSCAMQNEWRYGMEVPKKEPALPESCRISKALNRELDLALVKTKMIDSDEASSFTSSLESKVKKGDWQRIQVGNNCITVQPQRQVLSGSGRRNITYYETAGPHKARCGLCNLYFSRESVSGITCNKHILAFRSARGESVNGRRFETPSFLYQEVKLCVFCSQLELVPNSQSNDHPSDSFRQYDSTSPVRKSFFVANHLINQNISERLSKATAAAKLSSRGASKLAPKINLRKHSAASCISARTELDDMIAEETRLGGLQELEQMKNEARDMNNLALRKVAWQSSTIDGRAACKAVELDLSSMGSCTKREYEAWWEVDLAGTFPIKCIQITHEQREEQGAYIFLTSKPLGRARLNETKKLAFCSYPLQEDATTTVWSLPINANAACVRIQTRGVRDLSIKHVIVEQRHYDDNESSDEELLDNEIKLKKNLSFVDDDALSGAYTADGQTIGSQRKEQRCRPLSGRSGYARGRTIVTRNQNPTNVELSLTQSKTLGSFGAMLRRGKSANADFAAFPVDQLYWRTLLRYERLEATASQVRRLEASFLPDQLDWLKNLFKFCRDHKGKGPDAAGIILSGIGKKIIPNPIKQEDFGIVEHQHSVSSSNNNTVSTTTVRSRRKRNSFDDLSAFTKIENKEEDKSNGFVQGQAVYLCLEEIAAHLTRVEKTWLHSDAVQAVARELGRITGITDNDLSLKALADAANSIPEPQRVSISGRRCSVFLGTHTFEEAPARKASISNSCTSFAIGNRRSSVDSFTDLASSSKQNELTLSVYIHWPQFLALLALVRDRSISENSSHQGLMDEVATALDLELDFRAVNPLAAERNHVDRVSSARPISRVRDKYNGKKLKKECNHRRLLISEGRFRHISLTNEKSKEKNESNTSKITQVRNSLHQKANQTTDEYMQNLQRRRERWRQFEEIKAVPKSEKYDLKLCALCQYEFTPMNLIAEVSQQNVFQLLQLFGVEENELVGRGFRRVGTASSRTLRQSVCRFCAQFFDPDSTTGLAARPDITHLKYYEPFFDDRFPDRMHTYEISKTREVHNGGTKDGGVQFTATIKKQRASSARNFAANNASSVPATRRVRCQSAHPFSSEISSSYNP